MENEEGVLFEVKNPVEEFKTYCREEETRLNQTEAQFDGQLFSEAVELVLSLLPDSHR